MNELTNGLFTGWILAFFLGFIPAIIYGVLLFIVAFIHSLFLSDHSGIRCPACKNWIKEEASVCKYCHVVLADYYREHSNLPMDKHELDDDTLL